MKESITRWHERIRALLIVCVELNQKLPRRPAPLFEISWSISVGPFTACPCATTLRHCRPNAIAEKEADDHQKFHFLWPKKGPGAEGNVCRVASFLFSLWVVSVTQHSPQEKWNLIENNSTLGAHTIGRPPKDCGCWPAAPFGRHPALGPRVRKNFRVNVRSRLKILPRASGHRAISRY